MIRCLGPLVTVLLLVAPGVGLHAQAPAAPDTYRYRRDGRRDPFVPVLGRAPVAPRAGAVTRPAGVGGLLISEVVVRGLLESHGAWLAMVAAPDGRTFTLRQGDRLWDGTVKAVTSDAVVLLRRDGDGRAGAPREVRKALRDGDEGW